MRITISKNTLLMYVMVGVLALSGLIFLKTNLLTKPKTAHIVFAELKHDFGEVKQGPDLNYTFVFTNEGSRNLKIERIRTFCGCTAATIGRKDVYRPGEKGELKITYKTHEKKGKQIQSIILYSNDEENNPVYLTIKCDIAEKK